MRDGFVYVCLLKFEDDTDNFWFSQSRYEDAVFEACKEIDPNLMYYIVSVPDGLRSRCSISYTKNTNFDTEKMKRLLMKINEIDTTDERFIKTENAVCFACGKIVPIREVKYEWEHGFTQEIEDIEMDYDFDTQVTTGTCLCDQCHVEKQEIITVFNNIEKYFDTAVQILKDRMDKYRTLSSYNNNDIRTKIYKGHKFVALFEWEKPFDSIFSYVGNDIYLVAICDYLHITPNEVSIINRKPLSYGAEFTLEVA